MARLRKDLFSGQTTTPMAMNELPIGKWFLAMMLLLAFVYDFITNVAWTLGSAGSGTLALACALVGFGLFLSLSELWANIALDWAKAQKGHNVAGPLMWLLFLFTLACVGIDLYASVRPITDAISANAAPLDEVLWTIVALTFSLLSSAAQVFLLPTLRQLFE